MQVDVLQLTNVKNPVFRSLNKMLLNTAPTPPAYTPALEFQHMPTEPTDKLLYIVK